MRAGDPLVELIGVTRTFEAAPMPVRAVDTVSLSVSAGDYIAITGPSGSGKSTLLNLLGLLDQPTTGTHRIASLDVTDLAEATRSRLRAQSIGFVFQQFHLMSHRSALDNVQLGLLYQGVPIGDRRRMAEQVLEEVGLDHRRDATPRTLSGGEQQRVAIARAIVGSRRLILCDEPTGNLDSETTWRVLEVLDGIRQSGRTILVVTHDRAVSARADRQYLMQDGRLNSVDQHSGS